MEKELVVKSMVVKSTDEYVIQLEAANGHTFVHLQTFKWNKNIYQRLVEDFNLLLDDLNKQGVELLFLYGREKQIKFARMLGKDFYSFTSIEDDHPGYFVVSWET